MMTSQHTKRVSAVCVYIGNCLALLAMLGGVMSLTVVLDAWVNG